MLGITRLSANHGLLHVSKAPKLRRFASMFFCEGTLQSYSPVSGIAPLHA